MHHLTKTGSGQTQGKHSKKEWRFPLGLASKELYDEIYETCK